MVSTRSTRASARLRKKEAEVEPVEEPMEEEKVEEAMEEDPSLQSTSVDSDVPKSDANELAEEEINHCGEKDEANDVEKPDKVTNYMKGFVKRVVVCTILVMAAKNSWPYIQSRFWPEEPTKEGKLYILNDKSFRGHTSRGEHFIMMYAPWCGHCQRLKPDWDKLAKKPGVTGVSIAKVDCTASTTTCGDYKVQGYPTLLYFRDGKKIDTYDGAKTLEGLKEYLKKMRRGGKASDKEPGKAKKHATPVKSKKKKSEKVDL